MLAVQGGLWIARGALHYSMTQDRNLARETLPQPRVLHPHIDLFKLTVKSSPFQLQTRKISPKS